MNQISQTSYDFANILFSGKCNAKCPYCIGQKLETLYPGNLNTFPLKNFDKFLDLISLHNIPEVIFTWTTTDPLLYRYQNELLDVLDNHVPQTRKSIHTNGFLIMRKLEEFNRYTKCALSVPSFSPEVFRVMMWTKQAIPNIQDISQNSDIPIKISRIVDVNNNTFAETESFINNLEDTKVKRVAFRKLFWDLTIWDDTIWYLEQIWAQYTWEYRWNPIYTIGGIEITLWSFDNTDSKSINLFSNGYISDRYLLSESKK